MVEPSSRLAIGTSVQGEQSQVRGVRRMSTAWRPSPYQHQQGCAHVPWGSCVTPIQILGFTQRPSISMGSGGCLSSSTEGCGSRVRWQGVHTWQVSQPGNASAAGSKPSLRQLFQSEAAQRPCSSAASQSAWCSSRGRPPLCCACACVAHCDGETSEYFMQQGRQPVRLVQQPRPAA